MIVPMRAVTVVVCAGDEAEALARLQELGVLHPQHLQTPTGPDLDRAKTAAATAAAAVELLPVSPQSGAPLRAGQEASAPSGACPDDETAAVITTRITAATARRKAIAERLAACRRETAALAGLGDFDPADLTGLGVRLLRGEAGTAAPVVSTGAMVSLGHDRDRPCWAWIGGAGAVPVGCEELPPPPRRLSAVQAEIAALEGEAQGLAADLAALAPRRDDLMRHAADLDVAAQAAEALAGARREAVVTCLCGWIPAERLDDLRAAAAACGWGLAEREPRPDEDPPTLVRTPRWARSIDSLMALLGIRPGYREPDPGAIFLPFFTFFVSMLIADTAYGALMLGGALALRLRPVAAISREAVALLAILGGGTLLWGMATGSCLGISKTHLPCLPWFAGDKESVDRLSYLLCFVTGALHMSAAHLWNAIRLAPRLDAVGQIGWLAIVWMMFGVAIQLVLGIAVPLPLLLGLGLGGVVLAALPMLLNLRNAWADLVMMPLTVIGNFGDIMSYLRLFLVGSTGAALIDAFNGIAFKDLPLWAGIPVIIIAHLLNLALCALAVLVHGVRLNALEFSLHLGIQWSGRPYRPLARPHLLSPTKEPS